VLDGSMAQAGDPTGTGMGGPGYRFQDEIYPGGSFDRPGLLAMANSGPGTNGSQFFITFAPTPWLDGRHTIFGEVINGQDVLDRLTRRDPQQGPAFEGDLLETIEIREEMQTPYTPSSIAPQNLSAGDRPLAALPMEERSNLFNTAPDLVIDPDRSYLATVTTSQGDVVIALNANVAPTAVNNFVLLSSLGYYDGTPVNDVSEVIIFGAPENIRPSFVGYLIYGELNPEIEWGAGAIAYLPAQDPLTGDLVSNGSQVLIFLEAPPIEYVLQFSFFGEVVEGLEILQSLTIADIIESITIAVGEE
jgi:cyclophilin family peptidyl-prolyl cis-trans isomerase